LLYAATSLFSSVNIGYRHLLPLLPFLYIGIARCAVPFTSHGSRFTFYTSRLALGGLLLWLMAGTLGVAPHYLTFFNEIAGGPENGYRYLVDSNLDWGQTLWDLRAWMEENERDHVYYAHYSPARPEAYGINVDFLPPDPRAVPLTPWHPAPGLYAIGATVLQGPYAPDVNTYAWFRAQQPTARLGNALFLYDVLARAKPGWVGVCTHPDVALSDDVIAQRLGTTELRILRFDCTQSQVFARKGPGLYVLPAEVRAPASAELTLRARRTDGELAYAAYRVQEAPLPENSVLATSKDGPLRFLGYQIDRREARPGERITLETFWRVESVPEHPLSLMAHLVDATGVPIAVGDGLGVPIDQWRRDDVIVQQHPLEIPSEAVAGLYTLTTGGYWLETMERWRWETLTPSMDHLTLTEISLEE